MINCGGFLTATIFVTCCPAGGVESKAGMAEESESVASVAVPGVAA